MKVYQTWIGNIEKHKTRNADIVIVDGYIVKDRDGSHLGKQIGYVLVVFEEV